MNPRIAQSIYALGTVITGLLSVLLIWGGIEQGTADSIGQIIGGLGTLLGGTGPLATATVRTTRQRADGTLGDPLGQVLAGVEKITATRDKAAADFDTIAAAVGDQLGSVPVLGDLAQAVIATTRR